MDYVSLSLSVLLGAFVTTVCINLLMPVALHIGLVDTPGGRKKHIHPVPLIGGIAIFMGFCFALLCFNISLRNFRGLLAGSSVLLLIGVMDDFHELTPRIRLLGQCFATLLLMELGHLSVMHLGNLFFLGDINLGWFSFPFTTFFVLGFVNAINMIDGNDGLAGMIVLGQALFFVYLAVLFHQTDTIYVLLLLSAPLCVFLHYNLACSNEKRASVFLGDAGSTFLGFVIAWFAVSLSQVMSTTHLPYAATFNPLTLMWVLAYPLFDLLAVIAHRLRAGKSPFSAGRDHFHHLLLDGGFSRVSITFMLFALSVALGAIGIVLADLQVPESCQLVAFFGFFLAYFVASIRLLVYCTRGQLILN